MSIPDDPSRVTGYGTLGSDTARRMATAANNNSLTISYDGYSRTFTVLDSSDLPKATIERIFDEQKYEGWKPNVLDERDGLGNLKVKLNSISWLEKRWSRCSVPTLAHPDTEYAFDL